jgi:frataxin-like iron-binding protein CyaY
MIPRSNSCSQVVTPQTDRSCPVSIGHGSRLHSFIRNGMSLSIGLLFLMLGLCHPSQAQQNYTYNPNHLDTAKIIQAMKTPHSDLRILSAHRGLHAKLGDSTTVAGTPENSIGSLEAGAIAGLELMEFDVKLTSDGIPICSHDLTWGRETNPEKAGGNVFDPFTSPGTSGNIAANPRIDSMTAAYTQANYNLRDSVSFLPNYGSNHNVPALLQDVIKRINQDQIASVLALDVKDAASFQTAWLVVKANNDWQGNSFATHVVWKVNGGIYQTPAAFKAAFGASNSNGTPDYALINFWPNYNTGQIAPVTEKAPTNFGSEQAMINSLNLFWSDSELSVIAPEITQKQPGGILDQMRQTNINNGHPVAEFAAYKDYVYPNDPNQVAQFFWTGGADPTTGAQLGGSCCVDLAHYYFNNPVTDSTRPSDTADERGDFHFVVNQMEFNVITTDDVINWSNELTGLNLRNLSYMQQTGYGGDPHCNVGDGQYPGCDANGQSTYTSCATEGGNCIFSGDRNVVFGANGHYTKPVTYTNSVTCSNASLGPDPLPGVVKACYISPPIPYTPGIYCADADESQNCNFGGDAWAIMAANGKTEYSTDSTGYAVLYSNQFPCDTSIFARYHGSDPAPGFKKACFFEARQGYVISHKGPPGYVFCEGQGSGSNVCQFSGPGRIAYGATSSSGTQMFNYRVFNGGVACNDSSFGDPAPGYTKDCYYEVVTASNGVTGTQIGNGPGPGGSGSGTSTCDIYASGGTPCVAAHSTVRALFGGYSGRLYQVKRASDGTTLDIGTLATGGYANAAAQDTFCASTTCTVAMIYDQTSHHNDLPVTHGDSPASANAMPVIVNGNSVYGLKVTPGVGYRNNATNGVATGQSPEGMYMVTSGKYVNGACCFDYGNAEPSATDTRDGAMDALNFGTFCEFTCSGSGPWVEADLENGQYMGNGTNLADVSMGYDFVTAMLKNNGTDTFALKGGNAQSGSLVSEYSGSLPTTKTDKKAYIPMHLEGAIVLGTGGDNSNGGQGIFFEGAMTSGYPTDDTENAIQSNIVAAGYSCASSGCIAGTGGTGVVEPAGSYTGPSDPNGPGLQDGFASPAAIQANDVMATKPALASFNGSLYVAFQGVNVNNDLYVTSSSTGTNFPMATQYTNLQSSSAPALAAFNGQLFMAFRGLNVDNDFYITSSSTGSNFPTATRYTNIQMGGAPALAVFNNQLCASFQANDSGHTLHVTCSSDGVTWPAAWQVPNVAIGSDPAMAVSNGVLYIAFRANDPSNDVWVASSTDGHTFNSQVLTGQTVDGYSSPALVASNGALYYIYEANDQGHEMLVTASTDGSNWEGPAAYLGLQMGRLGPGAAEFANGVTVGFQSNDSRNVLFITNKVTQAATYTGPTDGGSGGLQDGFTPAAAIQPNIFMGSKPALASFRANLFAGFEGFGGNHSLYVTASATGSNFPTATQYANIQMSSAPAMAQFNNQLFVAFRGLGVNNDLYTTSSPNGLNFPTATQHTNIQMGGAPAMALFNNKLYIAFQANDSGHTLHVTSSSDGVNFPAASQISNVAIGSDPAIAAFNGLLYIAFRANDPSNDVWIASSSDGVNFTSYKLAGQTMAAGSSPALAVVLQNDGNYLYYVYEADDANHEMLVSTSTDGSSWKSPAVYSNTNMGATGPAAAGFGKAAYVGFQSNDSRDALFVTSQPMSAQGGPGGGTYLPNSTFYPRLVRLSHGATATNGNVVASTDGNIFVSVKGSAPFLFTGTVPSQYGYHLGSGTLYELPQTVGSLPAGTLLYAATYYYGSGHNTAIEVNTSTDGGITWNYSSMPVSGAGYAGDGFWEPQFTVANDGALVMFWSDETDPCCSQKISQIRTYNGTTWQDRSNAVASNTQADRPGMAVVTKLPSGTFFMSYEICGPGNCNVYSRTSTDGWNFGTPSNLGTLVQTASGQYFRHAPTNVWSPSVLGINGALLLVGQQMFDSTGAVDPNGGSQMFVNLSSDGSGPWYTIAAPVKVPNPADNYCPNYSTALLPAADGSSIFELASGYNNNNQCVSFTGSESWNNLPTDGTYYSLKNQHSNSCLGGGATSSSPAVQTTCTDSNGVLDQYWQVRSQGRGWFTLESNKSLCLDNPGGSNTPGNKVVVWTCTGNNTNQNWQFRDLANGQFTIWNQAAQLPLDDTGGSTVPGTQLEIWIDNSLDAEHWVISQ